MHCLRCVLRFREMCSVLPSGCARRIALLWDIGIFEHCCSNLCYSCVCEMMGVHFRCLCTVAFRWDEYSIVVVSSCGRCWCVSFYPFGFLVFIAKLPTLSRESNLQHLPGGEQRSLSLLGSDVPTWLILPVVICLSQRLSHACLSISFYTVKLRMAH